MALSVCSASDDAAARATASPGAKAALHASTSRKKKHSQSHSPGPRIAAISSHLPSCIGTMRVAQQAEDGQRAGKPHSQLNPAPRIAPCQ
ncbi:uncharacterized protein BDZ99DRAFT_458037 [Mytilinidion resinicola]|uniref:Uncharacterized protein n=1 Tax=Mytilinidion resinicola TaxID=574789 RepID=A0A6A6Z541_9PEZI|nr:uncharacterized protein BDZ99DRAFT_458037 [Mytilinidion resinicola]KAF2816140.1 hypothetical protein BDZ99DRAFT_458037 [Mytilinidion resinicola]